MLRRHTLHTLTPKSRLSFAWRLLAWIGIASFLIPLAGYLALKALIAPLPGEWTTQVRVGPIELDAGVPSLVRLATSHWVAPRLDGVSWPTRAGRLEMQWLGDSKALSVRCAPCTLRLRGMGDAPVTFSELKFTVQRDFNDMQGLIEAGAVRGSWQGELSERQVRLALDVPMTPITDGYALFAAHIPELSQARIDGRFALRARVNLPNGEVQLMPRVEGFTVSGLGTGALAGASSACSDGSQNPQRKDRADGTPGPERIAQDGWLARAVIAAEDQRFWQHAGYDIAELGAAFNANQRVDRIARGGSTLPQQLAKLLVTGAERSPARKLRELLYAADMEQSLGKARILNLYMENAPWGPGVCGAHAAARHYFGTRVSKLTSAQAVWLAAMLHNPGMEAGRWAERGQIDLVRASWVAKGVRGITRQQRTRLAQDMAEAPLWNGPQRK